MQREFMLRAQAPLLRVPRADGTLVPTPGVPSDDLVPSLLACSDVLGTGWFAADAANVTPVLPLDQGAEGFRAMDERRAIKAAVPKAKRMQEERWTDPYASH
jgi:hypothetical protein